MSSIRKLESILQLPAPSAAPLLLGAKLVRHLDGGGKVEAIITEVEAYQEGDPASHTFNGRTARTQAMFGPPAHAYIYFTYGMHWCFNITADSEGKGSGVLIRSVEIVEGIEAAIRQRFGVSSMNELSTYQRKNIANGPGKVAQSLAIDKALYGQDLLSSGSPLRLMPGVAIAKEAIVQTPRIGISKATTVPWRWYIDYKKH